MANRTASKPYKPSAARRHTVTYDNIFHDGSGRCFRNNGTVMTVEGDKIALIVWEDTDAALC